MRAGLRIGSGELAVDLARPISLAIDLEFDAAQPRHFGAPAASSKPFAVPGFPGEVAAGASCNCRIITLIPHCNGTHTECVGHLTIEPLDAHRVVPAGLLPALVVSVSAVPAETTRESTDPAPQADDLLVTRTALEAAWPDALPFAPRSLVIRTLPNDAAKRHRDHTDRVPPYLTREAAQLLVARGIEHLVVDLPSIDRSHDEGRLTAHRIFFGLEPGVRTLADARRGHCTVTELAFVPDEVTDGAWLLELQVPALGGDAVPSRPLLYPLVP
ncbi:MAG: cyclase family protein [Pseudomonadota bacterium]